jgi:hypothetical protein
VWYSLSVLLGQVTAREERPAGTGWGVRREGGGGRAERECVCVCVCVCVQDMC